MNHEIYNAWQKAALATLGLAFATGAVILLGALTRLPETKEEKIPKTSASKQRGD